MGKKLFSSVLIGLLVCSGLAFAVDTGSSTQTSTVENQTPPKIKQGSLSFQWSYEAKTTKEALEINRAYLEKVQAIAKKYKIVFKETANSYSISKNNGYYGYTKAPTLQISYNLNITFELGNLPINAIILEFDALEYTSVVYNEYEG